MFDPFDMTDIAVRHHGTPFGKATPHTVTRHSHPKARPETVDAAPVPTGIDYLNLVAGAASSPVIRCTPALASSPPDWARDRSLAAMPCALLPADRDRSRT